MSLRNLIENLKPGDILFSLNEYTIEESVRFNRICKFVSLGDSLNMTEVYSFLPGVPPGIVIEFSKSFPGWHKINKQPKDFLDLKLGILTGKYIVENRHGIVTLTN